MAYHSDVQTTYGLPRAGLHPYSADGSEETGTICNDVRFQGAMSRPA